MSNYKVLLQRFKMLSELRSSTKTEIIQSLIGKKCTVSDMRQQAFLKLTFGYDIDENTVYNIVEGSEFSSTAISFRIEYNGITTKGWVLLEFLNIQD